VLLSFVEMINPLITSASSDADTILPLQEEAKSGFNIVDLGTGSGILALKLAQYFPEQTIYAVDIDKNSLNQARENQKNLNIQNILWLEGDFLEALPREFFEKISFVISNPPYLSQKEFEEIAIELKSEPSQALMAGKKGTEAYEKILNQMKLKCLSGSCAVFEIGETQGAVLFDLFRPHFQEVNILKDLAGKNRILQAVKMKPIQ
jgi:release factor glutamine methyltransferase